jgi:hypothetical protein
VWAAGTEGDLLRWNGSAWTSVESGTWSDLRSVWGSGPDDVWAAGWWNSVASGGDLVHWNGTAWSSVWSGTTVGLQGVWGTGAGDVWVVGEGSAILERRM